MSTDEMPTTEMTKARFSDRELELAQWSAELSVEMVMNAATGAVDRLGPYPPWWRPIRRRLYNIRLVATQEIFYALGDHLSRMRGGSGW
jgi:hypothetical protein